MVCTAVSKYLYLVMCYGIGRGVDAMMSLIDICKGSRYDEGDGCGVSVSNILHGGEGRCDCCRWTRIGA